MVLPLGLGNIFMLRRKTAFSLLSGMPIFVSWALLSSVDGHASLGTKEHHCFLKRPQPPRGGFLRAAAWPCPLPAPALWPRPGTALVGTRFLPCRVGALPVPGSATCWASPHGTQPAAGTVRPGARLGSACPGTAPTVPICSLSRWQAHMVAQPDLT